MLSTRCRYLVSSLKQTPLFPCHPLHVAWHKPNVRIQPAEYEAMLWPGPQVGIEGFKLQPGLMQCNTSAVALAVGVSGSHKHGPPGNLLGRAVHPMRREHLRGDFSCKAAARPGVPEPEAGAQRLSGLPAIALAQPKLLLPPIRAGWLQCHQPAKSLAGNVHQAVAVLQRIICSRAVASRSTESGVVTAFRASRSFRHSAAAGDVLSSTFSAASCA